MTHQLFQLPKQTNISSNLTLLSGAKAQFYLTGTTTPTDTYQDSARTTPHTNPVEADAAGVFPPIYFDPTIAYKLVLKTSAEVTLYTADPVNDQVISQAIIGATLYPRTQPEIDAGVVPVDYAYARDWVLRHGAIGDGVTDDSAAAETTGNIGDRVYFPSGYTYLIATNVDISVDGVEVVGEGITGHLKLSGNNRRCFAVQSDDVSFANMYMDGQKPTVGWETSNNFDFGVRVGEGVSAQVEGFRASGGTMKDVGLDGIYLGNVNNAVIEGYTFINCRRAGVAIVSGAHGTSNITVRDCRFLCDFDGGPSGKERPIFAIDVEPDSSDVDAENIILENLYIHQGRLSMFGNVPATIIGGVIRGCDIVGEHGELAIDACDPEVTDVNLLDGAYAVIDNQADSIPARPYIRNLRSIGRTQEFNADGRTNLLPRDVVCSADGSPSISGTGSISQISLNIDGIPCSITSFALTAGSGVASVALPTTASVSTDDNVWVLLEIERTDGNINDDDVVRVQLGTTLTRTYAVSQGRQWIVVAVRATGADSNPSFTFGLNGSPSANVSVRCYRAFFFINPAIVDMPSLKVVKSSASKSFASWTGPDLEAYNRELCVLAAGSGQNLDSIKGAVDQVVGLQSTGSTITLRDAGTSSVSANDGGIKLQGGGTATLTRATFRRHVDGYWYQV